MKCTIFSTSLTIIVVSEAAFHIPKPFNLVPAVPKPVIVPQLAVPKPASQNPVVSSKTTEDIESCEESLSHFQ